MVMYDRLKSMTLTDTVVELQWTNPHVLLLVNGKVDESDEPPPLLLHDLPAVIAAGDPAQGCAEGLGVDGGGKIFSRAAPRADPGAAQYGGDQVAIEVRQARPESAGELQRQSVVRMIGIFRRTA